MLMVLCSWKEWFTCTMRCIIQIIASAVDLLFPCPFFLFFSVSFFFLFLFSYGWQFGVIGLLSFNGLWNSFVPSLGLAPGVAVENV